MHPAQRFGVSRSRARVIGPQPNGMPGNDGSPKQAGPARFAFFMTTLSILHRIRLRKMLFFDKLELKMQC
jgi:hypothetical protein